MKLTQNYEKFFKDLIALKSKQELRKKQGINDYNILTSVLSEHDEVRLHSRMIASFLDSQGYHYQDSLFFDLFMETLGLADFGMDSANLEIITEYNNIDIYITDGARYIIIENKIYASDAEAQIQRYVDSVYKENKELEGTDLLVLYLSINRASPASPSQTSLGNLTIQPDARGDKLMEGDKFKAYFKNINYATHILPWLERCQKEVKNIANLNMAFDQYAQVVRNITNTNERTKMTLAEIFNSNPEHYELALELIEGMPKFRQEKMTIFLNEAQKQLNEKIQNEAQGEWECTINNQRTDKAHELRLVIEKRETTCCPRAVLAFSFDSPRYQNAYFGITITENPKARHNIGPTTIEKKFSKEFDEKIKNMAKEIDNNAKNTPWWITLKWHPCKKNTDFIKYILETKDACGDFVKTIWDFFKKHKNLIEEINNLISPKSS